jgi:hypothetical protein
MKRLLVLVALAAAGCGDDPSTPPTPVIAQVGGVWSYRETTTAVTGGECVGPLLQSFVGGVDTGTLQITQSGSALTARATLDSNGSFCDYTGTAGASSFVLNVNFCSSGNLSGIACTNGARRDVRLLNGSINASMLLGANASGTTATTYNVLNSTTFAGVGTLTINGSFTATRR